MFETFTPHLLWWLLALLLIVAEVVLPGYFLLWIGLGAAATGVLAWAAPGLGLLGQVVGFGLFAVAFCALYAYGLRPRLARGAGREHLNRRGEQLLGQRYVLIEPIVNGRGKARVGDSEWLVAGPDLPVGATVEVFGLDGTVLKVRGAA